MATTAAAAAIALAIAAHARQRFNDAHIPRPMDESSACQLHYTLFHLVWTVPLLILLYTLAVPFLTALDWAKLCVLPIIAFVWTTPWDNALVRNGAWWYPHRCVAARIGYVPIEEYCFFVLQSLITTLFTILVTRWATPRPAAHTSTSAATVLLPAVPLITFAAGITMLLSYREYQYYLAMILWWASVPLSLLWYGTCRSWVAVFSCTPRQAWAWLACIGLPTAYLCAADVYALRRNTWHIAERKSLQFFVFHPELPIEEALFFCVTNTILVSACFAFDRVAWHMRVKDVSNSAATLTPISPTYFRLSSWRMIAKIWTAFLHLDSSTSKDDNAAKMQQRAQDHAHTILRAASKSFYTASALLPWDLRVDLGCVYAFARAMDDVVDASPNEGRVDSTAMLKDLVDAAFATDESASVLQVAERIDEILREHNVAADERKKLSLSAQAASTLRGIVPVHIWTELLHGYAADVGDCNSSPCFQTFEEQASYAQDVAGSVGEMCVRIVLARAGFAVDKAYRTPRDLSRAALARGESDASTKEASLPIVRSNDAEATSKATRCTVAELLRDARRMGVCLQLVNMARDVIKDAQELRRCYLVLSPTDAADVALRRALTSTELGCAANVDMRVIFTHKLALLAVADEIYVGCAATIDRIPVPSARAGLRAACEVYMAIGYAIRRDGVHGCTGRSHVTNPHRALIALRAVYGGNRR